MKQEPGTIISNSHFWYLDVKLLVVLNEIQMPCISCIEWNTNTYNALYVNVTTPEADGTMHHTMHLIHFYLHTEHNTQYNTGAFTKLAE